MSEDGLRIGSQVVVTLNEIGNVLTYLVVDKEETSPSAFFRVFVTFPSGRTAFYKVDLKVTDPIRLQVRRMMHQVSWQTPGPDLGGNPVDWNISAIATAFPDKRMTVYR